MRHVNCRHGHGQGGVRESHGGCAAVLGGKRATKMRGSCSVMGNIESKERRD